MTSTTAGVITIRVPKNQVGSPPAGAEFHSVTVYALSERGPMIRSEQTFQTDRSPRRRPVVSTPDPTSLPVQLDASGG